MLVLHSKSRHKSKVAAIAIKSISITIIFQKQDVKLISQSFQSISSQIEKLCDNQTYSPCNQTYYEHLQTLSNQMLDNINL